MIATQQTLGENDEAFVGDSRMPEPRSQIDGRRRAFYRAAQIKADLAYAYALSGRKREALARLKEIKELSKSERGFAYDVAVIYAVWVRKNMC